jgi:hypothetical protein
MSEVVFVVEQDPEGGYTAHAVGETIFTQGDDLDGLRRMVRDAVRCRFPDEALRPKVIRLHRHRPGEEPPPGIGSPWGSRSG